MQTLEGGKNLRKSMIKKYGSEEAWKEVMRSRGKQGGKASGTGGFYYAKKNYSIDDPRHPANSGKKGGKARQGFRKVTA